LVLEPSTAGADFTNKRRVHWLLLEPPAFHEHVVFGLFVLVVDGSKTDIYAGSILSVGNHFGKYR
jgi:hypothetical protein